VTLGGLVVYHFTGYRRGTRRLSEQQLVADDLKCFGIFDRQWFVLV